MHGSQNFLFKNAGKYRVGWPQWLRWTCSETWDQRTPVLRMEQKECIHSVKAQREKVDNKKGKGAQWLKKWSEWENFSKCNRGTKKY